MQHPQICVISAQHVEMIDLFCDIFKQHLTIYICDQGTIQRYLN